MRLSGALAVLGLVAALASQAAALEPWRVMVRVAGKVESRQPGQEAWSPIWRSRILTDGDVARTLAASRATIRLADQSQFIVGADTQVEMTRFSLTPEGRIVVLHLQVGRVRARVAKALGQQSRFEVKTPNGVLAARGTEYYVEQAAEGGTWLAVFAGSVDAVTASSRRTFQAGERGLLLKDGTIRVIPPEIPDLAGADADLRRGLAEVARRGLARPGAPPPIFAPGEVRPTFTVDKPQTGELPGTSTGTGGQ